jgi:hypothetical protein
MLCFDESWKNLTERVGELPSHETFSQCLYKTRAVLWEIIAKKPLTVGQIWEFYTILRLQEEEKLFEKVNDRTARLLHHQSAVPPYAPSSSSSDIPASPVRSSSVPPPVVIDPSSSNNYILYHRSPSISSSNFPSSSSSSSSSSNSAMIHPGGGFVDQESRDNNNHQNEEDSSDDDSDGGFNDFDNHEEQEGLQIRGNEKEKEKVKEKAKTPVEASSKQSLQQQKQQRDVFTVDEGDFLNVQSSSSKKQQSTSLTADISSPITNHIRDLEVNDRPSSSVPAIIGASSSSSVPSLRGDSTALRHYQQTGEVNEYLNASMTAEALKAELAVTWKKTFMGITTNIYGGSKILTMKHINQLESVRVFLNISSTGASLSVPPFCLLSSLGSASYSSVL